MVSDQTDASGYGVGAVIAQIQDIPLSDLDPTIIHGVVIGGSYYIYYNKR